MPAQQGMEGSLVLSDTKPLEQFLVTLLAQTRIFHRPADQP
jgi:hypothetical protein